MLGPAPSASGEPSTWYADVAVPQTKSRGNSIMRAAQGSWGAVDDDVRGPLVDRKLRPSPLCRLAVDAGVARGRTPARPHEHETAGRHPRSTRDPEHDPPALGSQRIAQRSVGCAEILHHDASTIEPVGRHSTREDDRV